MTKTLRMRQRTARMDLIYITTMIPGSLSTPIRMFLVLTVLSLAPSILIMLTSFTRIIIVLHFVRTAIGTQTAPPNQVTCWSGTILTLFIMWPTFSRKLMRKRSNLWMRGQ